jgi:hypothetical protein
MIESFDKK